MPGVDKLIQEMLNLRWEYNGEPIIIGATGQVLNGQHTLVALILAEQDRKKDKKWTENWPEEMQVAKDIVFGVSESDKVVDSMDTCIPRSLNDVMWRKDYFRKMKGSE